MTQNSKIPEPKQGQHSRLTLDDAIAQYQNGLLTAAGLIYHAVKIYRQDGRKLRVKNVTAFCQRLKIHRSTFYKALIKLEQAVVGFKWEPTDGLALWFECSQLATSVSNGKQVSPIGDTESPIGDTESPIGDTESPIGDTESPIGDTNRSKAACSKDSSTSSTLYQLFINSLSESEREKFFEFVRKEAEKLPKLPVLIDKWTAANASELMEKFRCVHPTTTPAGRWESHPRWSEALEAMRRGVPRFIALGEGFEEMSVSNRRAMAIYAEDNGFVWGNKS
jgi:hypothetical protein